MFDTITNVAASFNTAIRITSLSDPGKSPGKNNIATKKKMRIYMVDELIFQNSFASFENLAACDYPVNNRAKAVCK